MTFCEVVTPEILTGNRLNGTIARRKRLGAGGLWTKGELEDHLKRPRNTINQWDSLLISLLPDYGKFWEFGKPLNDYQRWVLEKISNFQSRRQPFKTTGQIQDYVNKNAGKLTLIKYMEQFK